MVYERCRLSAMRSSPAREVNKSSINKNMNSIYETEEYGTCGNNGETALSKPYIILNIYNISHLFTEELG